MKEFSIDQIISNPVIMSSIFSVLALIVFVIIIFLWIKEKNHDVISSETSSLRLMTAEEVSKSAGASTGGLSRAHAYEFLSKQLPSHGDLVTGVTTTPPGSISDWHFHPNWATIAYVLQGRIRVEFGPGGKTAIEGTPGDFLFIPPGAGNNIHREQNIGDGEQVLIVFRVGKGTVATTVDGPAPALEINSLRLMTEEEVSKSVGAGTGGLSRAHAFEFLSKQLPSHGDLVTGVTKTPPESISDWHFHPNWATIAYVLQGKIRVEFGPGGKTAIEGTPGDFLFIPPGDGNNIHREQNIGDGEQVLIVFRVGKGTVATTVDGPALSY